MTSKITHFLSISVLIAAAACASQPPAAAETPASQPAESEDSAEHTMPDGTKMKGHKHGESGGHVMPDGTAMPGHDHGDSSGGEE